jgi:two-component system response regulator PilR (NtrC family)
MRHNGSDLQTIANTAGTGTPSSDAHDALRVLVVDDHDIVLELLGDLCRASQCITETAATAERALALLRHDRFDLVLSDVRMPRLDGFELLDAVKREQPEASVVLITGAPSSEDAALGRDRGAYDYLAKPFTSDEVRAVLRRVRFDRRAHEVELSAR